MKITDSFDLTLENLAESLLKAELNVIFVVKSPEGGLIEALQSESGPGEILLDSKTGQGCKILTMNPRHTVITSLMSRWEKYEIKEDFFKYLYSIGYEKDIDFVIFTI